MTNVRMDGYGFGGSFRQVYTHGSAHHTANFRSSSDHMLINIIAASKQLESQGSRIARALQASYVTRRLAVQQNPLYLGSVD